MHATATAHWKRGLDQLPDRELFDLEQQIDDLTKLPGWDRVVSWIGSAHAEVLKSLTQGKTLEHADYARLTGYLGGLEEAPNIIESIREAASRRRTKREKEAQVADQRGEGQPQ